jgi:mannose-1-phosphate guanylyltransferase
MERSSKVDVKVLIMSGGRGTRMWPVSSEENPKQFEKLVGDNSMFRETVERVLKGFDADDIYVATSEKYGSHLMKQAPELPKDNFILEPAMRDNLGAIGLATAIINYRHPDSVMIILWGADHVVQKVDNFLGALKEAAKLAYENKVIVHVDSPPSYPSVHNGWLKIGKQVTESNGHKVFEMIEHVEKPNKKKAEEFFESKKYVIHVGYMATQPSLLLGYYERYAPQAFETVKKIERAIDTSEFDEVLRKEYPKFEKLSVDYGLFEKLPSGSQWELPVDMGWIDVGTWELLYNGMPKDKDGNVILGNADLIDTKNTLVVSPDKRKLGLIGLEGMIVVDTKEGLLVCPLDQASKVKELYNKLLGQKTKS